MNQLVNSGGGQSSGDRTVVVGVKLDGQSRELLTWALVKVAQAGDRVIALHVLNINEIVNRDGKSSLLSLVKAFDSILEVYEGFCNLKQVNLKLKICRGSSIPKILVREAKAYNAAEVILGISHRTIRSSASVAKYCGRKLSKDCSILAVDNGKIVFHRNSRLSWRVSENEIEHHRLNCLFQSIRRSFSKNIKTLNNAHSKRPRLTLDETTCGKSDLTLASPGLVAREIEPSCTVCSRDSVTPNLEDASSSISLLLRENPGMKPGWPLLGRAIFSNKIPSRSSHVRRISVVQWALRLPNRLCVAIEDSNRRDKEFTNRDPDKSSGLDGESGAIVLVGDEILSVPILSEDDMSRSVPEELEEKYSPTCRLFKFEELVMATSGFSPGNMIGKGGSSRVYKGCLPDGKELAVKTLKPSEDVIKEFVLEIEIITALHHRNIISLFGFCFEDNNLLLVYDFIPRGSLEDNLHGTRRDVTEFGWCERYRVAIGVAEALEYLHNRGDRHVIHTDVKSSNILLYDDFEPRLSDFGLAKWASAISTHVTCTDVVGTFGYLAPEYFMYGKVSEKIEVYAYGVVLLELLSGRKPISDKRPKGQESLVMWAKPILNSGKFGTLLDENLRNTYDHEQVERVVLAALLCIRRAPRARPQMSLVLELLRGDADAVKWARMQVDASDGSQVKLDSDSREVTGIDDDDIFSQSNLRAHLNLALLGVEEDSSISSIEQSVPLADYMRSRWSPSYILN